MDIYNYLVITAQLISKSYFRDKIIFKGASVLVSKLIQCGRQDLYRQTSDLDIHCDSKEVWESFCSSIESILNSNDKGLRYKLKSRRSDTKGLRDSDSLKFDVFDSSNNFSFEIKMDMYIKSNQIIICDYSPILNMRTYDLYTMLSDKIVAVSSGKIYRRIKDVYDLAVLASISNYNLADIVKHLRVKHPDDELINYLTMDNIEAISHAYDKFSGIRNKPNIYDLIAVDTSFLQPVYSNVQRNMIWNWRTVQWEA